VKPILTIFTFVATSLLVFSFKKQKALKEFKLSEAKRIKEIENLLKSYAASHPKENKYE